MQSIKFKKKSKQIITGYESISQKKLFAFEMRCWRRILKC